MALYDTGINVLPMAHGGSTIISGELVGTPVPLPPTLLLLGSGLLGLAGLTKRIKG